MRRTTATAAILVLIAAGCAEMPDTSPRIRVAIPWSKRLDSREGIPKVRIHEDARLKSKFRKSFAEATHDGKPYEGELLEMIERREYGAPGTAVLEAVARRVTEGQEHIDIYVTSAAKWELVLSNFMSGILVNVATNRVVEPKYIFEPGAYHLKAYKGGLPAGVGTGKAG